jgi:hypothetical protein
LLESKVGALLRICQLGTEDLPLGSGHQKVLALYSAVEIVDMIVADENPKGRGNR